MASIICPSKSDNKYSKKIPSVLRATRFPTLILTSPILVLIWQREDEKTVLPRTLELRTTHLGQHPSLADLYQSLETAGEAGDYCKDNVVVLTSKASLEKRIMAENGYYKCPMRRTKHTKPVRIL